MDNLTFLRGILASRSVASVALIAGVPESAVRNIRNGRVNSVKADVMERLVAAFSLEAREILKWAAREPAEYPFASLLKSMPLRDVRASASTLVKDNPPTLSDVVNYMNSLPNSVDVSEQAFRFMAYYESNGWKVGKNWMVKWKAAAAGWMNRAKSNYYGDDNVPRESLTQDRSTAGRNTAKAIKRSRRKD